MSIVRLRELISQQQVASRVHNFSVIPCDAVCEMQHELFLLFSFTVWCCVWDSLEGKDQRDKQKANLLWKKFRNYVKNNCISLIELFQSSDLHLLLLVWIWTLCFAVIRVENCTITFTSSAGRLYRVAMRMRFAEAEMHFSNFIFLLMFLLFTNSRTNLKFSIFFFFLHPQGVEKILFPIIFITVKLYFSVEVSCWIHFPKIKTQNKIFHGIIYDLIWRIFAQQLEGFILCEMNGKIYNVEIFPLSHSFYFTRGVCFIAFNRE